MKHGRLPEIGHAEYRHTYRSRQRSSRSSPDQRMSRNPEDSGRPQFMQQLRWHGEGPHDAAARGDRNLVDSLCSTSNKKRLLTLSVNNGSIGETTTVEGGEHALRTSGGSRSVVLEKVGDLAGLVGEDRHLRLHGQP